MPSDNYSSNSNVELDVEDITQRIDDFDVCNTSPVLRSPPNRSPVTRTPPTGSSESRSFTYVEPTPPRCIGRAFQPLNLTQMGREGHTMSEDIDRDAILTMDGTVYFSTDESEDEEQIMRNQEGLRSSERYQQMRARQMAREPHS
ncbi:hypothetical protein PCE1_001389 [Barthelona sp. PCE]